MIVRIVESASCVLSISILSSTHAASTIVLFIFNRLLAQCVAPMSKGGRGRHAPPRASKIDGFGLADPNNSNRTKVTALFFAEPLRRAQARS
jgi:hypothetical protein